MSGEASASAVPPAAKGSWTSFLKSIASFNGDLSSLTAPAFILSPVSLVEFSAYWTEHPSLFVAPARESDPAKRAMLVLKWFLSTLKQQYCSRSDKLGSEKKPLNPFLGELFLGKWTDEVGETRLVSEQVSHHPPVTAYCIWNEKEGVRLSGYNAQKASFKSTINVKQIGQAVLHLDKWNEDYFITLPSLHIEALIMGSPFVELNRTSMIQSSSGFTAKVDYSGRGWISGKKNSFTASLYREGKEKDPLYTVDGQWSDKFDIKEGKGKKVITSYDANASKITPLQIAPVAEQDPLESRRAWAKVARAIEKGDLDTTQAEKSRIENEQRELRKKEREEGREWERRFFSRTEDTKRFGALARKVGAEMEAKQTNGVWVWDQEKYERARPAFKGGVEVEAGSEV